MSELTDLNATGNGLSAVSGGLQGLLEAYKMKMAQSVEQAKINQQGLDAGAQARMMMPFNILKANIAQAALDQKTAHEGATEATAQQVADQAARSATPNGPPVRGPGGELWNGKSWEKPSGSSIIPLKDQLDAKSTIDNLEGLKQMIPSLGLSDNPGAGQLANYARLAAESKMGGTAANKFMAKMSPAMMAQAHDIAGRFNMAEMPITSNAASFNNTGPSMLKNISDYQSQLIEKAGLTGYVPKPLADVPAGPAPAPAPTAAPAPSLIQRLTSLASPGASPAPASPAGSLPAGAAPAPGAPGGGKYAHLTDAQLAAMAQGQ